MKNTILIALFLSTFFGLAQGLEDTHIERLKEKYNQGNTLKCQILVSIDVEGMRIPDKEVYVEFSEGGKPIVKGKGLSLLPKRGTLEQFRELLSTPLQAIFLSKKGNNMVYKLVSLDPSSDWITADIVFDPEKYLIYESVVNTKTHGSFNTINEYDDQIYPSLTVVTFEAKKFKLPLKFIGSQQNADPKAKIDDNTRGKVVLRYSYL